MKTDMPKFIWVSASPSLKYFHRRLLNSLSKVVELEFWEYYQTPDEGSSIDGGIQLLHGYLSTLATPIHLIGHGIGGVIALGYARMYPTKIASLTLLSVAVQPAIDWHSYYYTQWRSLPTSRDCILRSIASSLFPNACSIHIRDLIGRLERDLVEAPSSNSLFRLDILEEGSVTMPLMVCGSQDDPVISSQALYGWCNYLKPADKIWQSGTGGHFFHHFQSELVSERIKGFWQLNQRLESDRLVSMKLL
ncbi:MULTISPECIES: alpha/beta hydrolase [unclassified Chamaesiphon]|uniref:alpha/beta fold hydrolase n=1 Tax=unclassified Chamaesiphon TaxID=2620921 RepID=UPI00286AFDEF|nr:MULTISPECIES: alpha/beta hydrolase [unclassified Chamaesiphon]